MQDLYLLSATEAAAAIANRDITSVELVEACLARIDDQEPVVNAWACIDRERALSQARQCDLVPPTGLLHGVPVGVKDVIDTKDFPTEYGSAIFKGHRPQRDAACITLVRRAGGIILGKTVTTEFAMYQPSKTANPHNTRHTPGGSSSGSAAAVADHHVPVAFGTQTSGSIIRPAAYCGVVGYKPSISMFAPDGIKPLGTSLDTLGLIARNVGDLSLMWNVLQGCPAVIEQVNSRPRRIGLCRTPYWSAAAEEQRTVLELVAYKLERNGFDVEEIALPDIFGTLNDLHQRLMAYEVARNYVFEYEEPRSKALGERTRQVIEEGWRVSPDEYLALRRQLRAVKVEFSQICCRFDALVTPSSPGEAPLIASTGDPVFNRMWTLLGVPAINLPVGKGMKGLPLGVQFVGNVDSDLHLLSICDEVEKLLKQATFLAQERPKGGNQDQSSDI